MDLLEVPLFLAAAAGLAAFDICMSRASKVAYRDSLGRGMARWAASALIAASISTGPILGATDSVDSSQVVTVHPEEYPGALRNPMKGFRSNLSGPWQEYTTIVRHYIRWNQLENDEADTIQKIKDFCNQAWEGVEDLGVKVIPRVYLDWDENAGNEYWPVDMATGDYTSEQFKQRAARLVARLGECWDNDPRVAWVQMGIVGYWGEHHSPDPTAEVEAMLGEAFAAAFKNKKVLVRRPVDFTEFDVGFYWDSWAHIQQIYREEHGLGIELLNKATGRWKSHPIEGETAYNWGNWREQPGDDPDDTLSDPAHREFLVDSIRNLHCSGLGWVSKYDADIAEVRQGAEEVQKAFGYRFVITEFSCSREAEQDGELNLSFAVVNKGSAPFYENWPLVFSLLDPETREPVWSSVLDQVDIRDWLPGDDWDEANNLYATPAETYQFDGSIALPGKARLPKGVYLAALSINDPTGGTPQVRFAVKNYFEGGRHPFSRVGVGVALQEDPQLDAGLFDDPMSEPRRGYALAAAAPEQASLRWNIAVSDGLAHLSGLVSGGEIPLVVQRATTLLPGGWEAIRVITSPAASLQWAEPLEGGPQQFFRMFSSGEEVW